MKTLQKFQFHKGTIRTGEEIERAKQAAFQFHKGTIRTPMPTPSFARMYYFNSIKVQLELRKLKSEIILKRHFNSIKVQLEQARRAFLDDYFGFQFHKGTIRTLILFKVTTPLCYFNSIKVQLEQGKLNAGINPALFQFHKGTIRTSSETLKNIQRQYFNSIKVQLER